MPTTPVDGPVVLPPLFYRRSPNQSQRQTSVKTVVLHDTEGGYNGAITWLRTPTVWNPDGTVKSGPAASAHLVLKEDGTEATQLVEYSHKAWSCAHYNNQSLNIEMAGVASKGFSDPELRRAARIVAFFLHKYQLPATHVRPVSGLLGKGWTLHQDLGTLGGGHHDPGFSPWKAWWFGRLVASELKRGGFRPQWGYDVAPPV